jgi:D-3-phosphoglycerate dehydrogenase
MTELGIPVFNTPGANANAVKELVTCAMFLAARDIVGGCKHIDTIFAEETDPEVIKKRVEKDKSMFGGMELAGKTLGVIGLGHIGAAVAETGLSLGMTVVGYDPAMSVESAWRLPGHAMTKYSKLADLVEVSDFISLHVPYIPDATHHLLGEELLEKMKPTAAVLNFSRAELVDSEARLRAYESGKHRGRYICDFPDTTLYNRPECILIPHLGASTEEAEENSAAMAADQMMQFLEDGTIRNSVNFPTTVLDARKHDIAARLCIVNRNESGVLAGITAAVSDAGVRKS